VIARVLAPALVAAFLAVGAAAETPRRGGTLLAAGSGGYSCLNPFGSCNLITAGVLSQTLEGAYEPDTDGIARPYLVSGVTIGRDRVTLTYHIRAEARWSDGVPVSTADFGFTYRTYATQESSPDREFYGKIRRFRALDAKTFRIELREPFAGWKDFFYEVLPQHALAGEDITKVWRDRVENPKTGRLIGNGPFLASRFEIGRQMILIRNPNYWGRHTAYLDRIVRRFNVFDPADPDPLGPLRRNEVDMAPFNSPLSGHAAEVRRLPGWRVASWPSQQDEHLVFRLGPGGHTALKNRLVRRALAYGIDRVQIARRTLPELGRRARPLDNTSFPAGVSSYRPNWSVYRYDPARARRLLAQAGCRRGADGIYSCGGERLRLRFLTTAGVPRRAEALELIKNQLKRAGVEVQPVYVPSPALFSTVLPGGNFDVALFNVPMEPGGAAASEAKCGDESNWAGYCTRLTMPRRSPRSPLA